MMIVPGLPVVAAAGLGAAPTLKATVAKSTEKTRSRDLVMNTPPSLNQQPTEEQ